ncbi:hypothetical protein C2E23DRAFT_549173 [Lenzites betulinus]|nr:hypothetical protein C2E23DRAFT_549173 [Lenzites betulinus]
MPSDTPSQWYHLGTHERATVVAAVRSHRTPYPPPSDHPSRPSSDVVRARHRELLEKGPTDYSTSRKQALVRDGYRCMVTRTLGDDFSELWSTSDGSTQPLKCCHILPEVLGSHNAKDEHTIASAWTMLHRFGYGALLDKLSGANIHRLENIMTLTMVLKKRFDTMLIWFEPIGNEVNCYRVGVGPPHTHQSFGLPHTVQFTTEENLSLPDPELLHIHAACSRIAHMSGAAEYTTRYCVIWTTSECLRKMVLVLQNSSCIP